MPSLPVRRLAVVVAFLALAAPSAQAQRHNSRLVGAVADANTGTPLQNAVVRLPDLHRSVRTDQMGRFVFDEMPKGIFSVQVRQLGYAPSDFPMKFAGEDSIEAMVMLEPRAVQLGKVTVAESYVDPRLREFDARRRAHIGTFLTEQDLEKEGDRDLGLLALSHLRGVRTVYDADMAATYLVSMRGASSFVGHAGARQVCQISVYLDGVHLSDGDVSWIRASDLAGVEQYSEAETPAQYRGMGAQCGVVLLWSKW